MKEITVFEISITDGEKICTVDKIIADKFLFNALFLSEVKFSYEKTKVSDQELLEKIRECYGKNDKQLSFFK